MNPLNYPKKKILYIYIYIYVDAHFGKSSRRKKPNNMGKKELVIG